MLAAPAVAEPTAKDAIAKFLEADEALREFQRYAKHCQGIDLSVTKDEILISDSFVKNLSCANLKYENVLLSLQPDAFSYKNHFENTNLGWKTEMEGQCWGISAAQRKFFYLARYGVNGAKANYPKTAQTALDNLQVKRGAFPTGLGTNNTMAERPKLKVFDLEEESLTRFYKEEWGVKNPFAELLSKGVSGRTFEKEVEDLQREKFFQLTNINLVEDVGRRGRSDAAHAAVMETIRRGVSQGRMPLIVVRATTTIQHVVLVKKVEDLGNGNFRLKVYDSNQPQYEPAIDFTNGKFLAPEVVSGRTFGYDPVGIFIKDEEDMDEIQQAVFEYYQKLCRQARQRFP